MAIGVALLAATVLVGAVVATVAAPTTRSLVTLVVGGFVVGTMWVVLGVFVARRTPSSVVGLTLCAVGLAIEITVGRDCLWQYLARRPDLALRFHWLVAATNEVAWWVMATGAVFLLHFPDGRLPSRRWRWAPLLVIVSAIAVLAGGAYEPFLAPLQAMEPFQHQPVWLGVATVVGFVVLVVVGPASAVSLVARSRRGPLLRAQIRWLALAGLGLPSFPLLCLIEIGIHGRPGWFSVAALLVSLVGIPVAAAIAIVRHDLYDVDRALAATVTWGLVSAVLLGLYAACSAGAGLVLGRGSATAAAGATAVCALALVPLRRQIQRVVDRRLYPVRQAALDAIDALQAAIALGRGQPEDLEAVLQRALRHPELRVGYRAPAGDGPATRQADRFVDAAGEPCPGDGVAIVRAGTTIGILVPGPSGALSDDLLRQVAERATTLVEMVGLRLQLRGAVTEVEASRARLLHIGDRERRRLERDLHDGAQQRLVSLGMALRLAQRHLGDGTVDVNDLLDHSVAELSIAVAELRQIAHGLRPTSLDDGLDAAVGALARNLPIDIDLDVRAPVLPDDIALTAYYVIAEALTNAVKHACASRITLQVAHRHDQLLVCVKDNGRGGATMGATSNLVDRVAALHGTLHVVSPNGGGTMIEAKLPCAS